MFFKHFLTHLICGLLVFGQIPAWWHVANCDDGCSDVTSLQSSDHGCSSCLCEHPIARSGETSATTLRCVTDSPEGHTNGHNSDACVICQSVSSPNSALSVGDIRQQESDLISEFRGHKIESIIKEIHTLSRPRAPPVG